MSPEVSTLGTRLQRFKARVFPSRIPVRGLLTLSLASLFSSSEAADPTSVRRIPLAVEISNRTGFASLNPETLGIRFTNALPFAKASANHNLLNGSGVALGDMDGDGLPDIYLCQLDGPNALYRNLGNWQFEDVTDHAGVACPDMLSTGATFADLNGNGRLDLLVTACGGPNAVFLNLGSGKFTNATESLGLLSRAGSTSMALADVTGNGALDLYIANYGENTIRSGLRVSTRIVGGREVVTGRHAHRLKIIDGQIVEYGEPDALWLNDGKGNFRSVNWTDGFFLDTEGRPLTEVPRDLGLAVQFRDLTGNGFPDIYVCNDFQTPDRIWFHDGKGRYRAAPATGLPHTSFDSMAVDFADINRDGQVDFFVVDMLRRTHEMRMIQSLRPPPVFPPDEIHDRPQVHRNTLFLNRGGGAWTDIAHFAGVAATDWSWSAVFLDVDLDGYEDLLIGNGHGHDPDNADVEEHVRSLGGRGPAGTRAVLGMYPVFESPNVAFRNRGDLTFEDLSVDWGFDSHAVSHGMALADLDGDGDLDVVVNCLNAPPLIYRNEAGAPRVAVRLIGRAPNTQAIGAKITLINGAVQRQSTEVIAGGRYLSGDDPLKVFAAGSHGKPMVLEVAWRRGGVTRVEGILPNHFYEIDEHEPELNGTSKDAVPSSGTAEPKGIAGRPWFESVVVPEVRHTVPDSDDFSVQPLLPRAISSIGPGLAWIQVGSGANSRLVTSTGSPEGLVLLSQDNNAAWKVERLAWAPESADAVRGLSITGMLEVPAEDGSVDLILGFSAGNRLDTSSPGGLAVVRGGIQGSPVSLEWITRTVSIGPLAVADMTGDGQLELFAGGDVRPGRHPEGYGGHFWRRRDGAWLPDAALVAAVAGNDIIRSAVMADLTGNGTAELVLACEWGGIRLFEMRRGTWVDRTSAWGLDAWAGLWNSVAVGDFDGDGRLDLIAGNHGLNSFRQLSRNGEWHLFYGEFLGDDRLQLLEVYRDPVSGKLVPWQRRGLVEQTLPWVSGRFATHREYGNAEVSDVLGSYRNKAGHRPVNTLASLVLLNRVDTFLPVQLPSEAQWAPVFGIAVADWDGDGVEDVFLAMNDMGSRPHEAGWNGGYGQVLRGRGDGTFIPLPLEEAGVFLPGESRAVAVGDMDGDGRPDLAISQKGGELRLYRNTQQNAGLRVRLVGPVGNPHAVGAVLRLWNNGKGGAAKALQVGHGYLSQNALISTLSIPPDAEDLQLEVLWPGGKRTRHSISPDQRSIEIRIPADSAR